MDWENIRFKIDTEFHLLRHFRTVSPELTHRLMEAGYMQEQIAEVLSLPGSKFHNDFATNINDLIDRLKNAVVEEDTGLNGNRIITADFPRDIHKEGIGTLAILPFIDLDPDQQGKVYLAENRGYLLKHLEISNLPYTWQLTMILATAADGLRLITAFPGTPGLPLPNEQMNKDMYEQCEAFWDKQVFLVEGDGLYINLVKKS